MADSVEPKPVKQGNVKSLRNQFSVKEDETLAYRLQNEEFSTHYLHNRVQRQNIRSNIPVAKDIQKVEMDELMRQQQLLNQLERDDAVVAEEIQRKFLEESNNLKRIQLTDEELAKKLQKNVKFSDNAVHDLANDFNNIDIYNENNSPEYMAKLQEEQDLEIAKYLQEQENRKSAMRTQQSRNHIQKTRTNPESTIYSDEDLARALQEEEDLKYNSTNITRNNNNNFNTYSVYDDNVNNNDNTYTDQYQYPLSSQPHHSDIHPDNIYRKKSSKKSASGGLRRKLLSRLSQAFFYK